MDKPFIYRGPTGYDQLMTVDDVLGSVDESPATRLAAVLYAKGVISAKDFLDVVRPRLENGGYIEQV